MEDKKNEYKKPEMTITEADAKIVTVSNPWEIVLPPVPLGEDNPIVGE